MQINDIAGRTVGDNGWVEWRPQFVPPAGFVVRNDPAWDTWALPFHKPQVQATYRESSSELVGDSFGSVSITLADKAGHWLQGTEWIDLPTVLDATHLAGRLYLPHSIGVDVDSIQVRHPELQSGDANGDGVFDQLDLVAISAAGRYLNGDLVPWSQGDFNGDGRFNGADLSLALQGDYMGRGHAAVVPEPGALLLLVVGLLIVVFCRYSTRR
jgi:hypothetical protein